MAVARYLGKAGPAVLPEMKGFCAAGAKPAGQRLILEWLGCGREEYPVSAGEGGGTHARSRFQSLK